ncbi:MAG: hypothetical protein WBV53_05610 [Solirubrobacterales bacterium]
MLNNATAYGYSVAVTLSLAVLSATHGGPTVGQVFLFGAGAVAGVVVVEGAASGLFQRRLRGEPAQVVVIGSALSLASVGLSIGAAALIGETLDGGVAWPIGAFGATVVYLLVVGVEMALAERASR